MRIGFWGCSIVTSILRLSGVRNPSQEGSFGQGFGLTEYGRTTTARWEKSEQTTLRRRGNDM